jgi:3-hydroxy-3-methylglutaryl CoA synthase
MNPQRRLLLLAATTLILAALIVCFPGLVVAQKVQENYKDKFDIAESAGGVAIAVSQDGKYVFVAGPQGVIVSDDYGKTGTWVQTVRMK